MSDQKQIGQLLRPLNYLLMAVVMLHGVVILLTAYELYRMSVFVFHLPMLAMLGVSTFLVQRGKSTLACWVTVSAFWLAFTAAMVFMGGIQAPTFIGGYIVLVVIAGLFLGYRVALGVAGLSILTSLVLAILRSRGLLAGPAQQNPIFVIWVAQSILLIGAGELVRIGFLNSNYSFDRSRREHKYFQSLIENSSDMVAVVDGLGRLTYTSPSVERIMGFPQVELIGKNAFDLVHPDDRGTILSEFSRLLLKPGGRQLVMFRIQNLSGDWRWVEAEGSNFLFDPDVQGVILNYRDITERKKHNERLEHDAIHDPLTGLPNRTLFLDRISSRLRRSQRHLEQYFAVLILDLDHFKNVNDSLGHSAGDELLLEVSRRLESCLRTSDTVARLGGDEFGILLDATDATQGAVQTVERMIASLGKPLLLHQHELLLGASVGVVIGPGDYQRPDDTLRDAEIAMYRAKELGRARYVIFNDRMRSGMLERIGLEAEIRRALTKNEFCVFYQPVYSLRTGLLAGFEALVRWQHPERGLLLPNAFLDVAEESGLIVELDRWVMREACRQLRVWQDEYPLGKSLIINVNLSRKHLTRGDLVDTVRSILSETGLDASCLRPEITESLFMESFEDAISIVRSLDGMGVRVEIDDFGTGHSSLALLAELKEVRTLKIDRQFIRSISEGADRLEIIRMIISLGYSLKKEVIAEGIETREQLDHLRSLDCEFGQGFYFSRGVSPLEAGVLIDLRSVAIE
jgi:diguanylate cyclase (GGDEF)-like protein/PAS domain S-box-containing protein